MAIYETYLDRELRTATPENLYQFDAVPEKLRVQIQQILWDAIGPHIRMSEFATHAPEHNPRAWEFVDKTLCREFGVHSLGKGQTKGDQVISFLSTCSAKEFVSVVEICVRFIARVIVDLSDHEREEHGINQKPKDALEEINHRFCRSGFGYRFEDGETLRVDSEFAHQEIVKPALRILQGEGFEGAREEFIGAHRHFRNGDSEEAITEAAKAFESTLKIVCDRHGWAYAPGSRSSDLLKIVRSNGLWPEYLDKSFDQLLATLSSGLPKVRNEQGAHGQGGGIRSTPPYIASYALHLAAAKILFIAAAAKAKA